MFRSNVGYTDRVIRAVAGVAIILAGGFYFKTWLGLLGLIPIFTAFTGFCGLYLPFGINTCKIPKKAEIK